MWKRKDSCGGIEGEHSRVWGLWPASQGGQFGMRDGEEDLRDREEE